MSCPDWKTLVQTRDALGRDPASWGDALAHLEDCPHCRKTALACAPSLLFRRLPQVALGADGIADMKRAVAVMRRTAAHQQAAQQGSHGRRFDSPWWRAAAVVAMLIALGLLQGTVQISPSLKPAPTPTAAALEETSPASPEGSESFAAFSPQPLVEDVQTASGTVIQLVDAQIDLLVFLSDEQKEHDV